MGTAVIASFAVTALWIIAHLVAMHISPAKSRMPAMFKAWLLSLPVMAMALALLNHAPGLVKALNGTEAPALSWICALVMHLLLFFLFVECFYHFERSVTLRLLIEIDAAKNPSINTIMKDYSVDDMIVRRLHDMERSGFVTKSGDRWALTTKAGKLARVMSFSCWLYQSKPQNERL